jgi:Tfp pilus assembly protein PilE
MKRYIGVMKLFTFVCLAVLTLTACDSKQEQARKAELDAQATKLDEAAKATEKNAAADSKATKKEGEAKAEALKEQADHVRDQKSNN